MGTSLFGTKEREYDPIREMKDSADIEINKIDFGDGEGEVEEPVVSFSLNPGRGTGKQTIPVRELDAYIEVLENALAGDTDVTIPFREAEETVTGYVPTWQILLDNLCQAPSGTMKETYTNREGQLAERTVIDPESDVHVMLRSKVGRGAKASHLPLERVSELVSVLSEIRENVDGFEDAAQDAWLKKQAKMAEKAAEKSNQNNEE